MKRWFALAALVLAGCQDRSNEIALGTVERDRVVLTATAAETVMEVLAREGQVVQMGDVLLRLDDRRQRARVAQAEAQLAQAQARLTELQNGVRAEEIAAAKARMEGATAVATAAANQLQRVKALFEQKLIGRADLDAAIAQGDSASASVRDAEEHWRLLLAGTRPEQLLQAEAQVQAAEAGLALEKQALAELEIVATRNGRVDSLPWHRGDRVAVGALLAVLLVDDAPYVRAYLPQRYRLSLNDGTKLQVQVDGVAETYTGHVRWISAEPAFTPFYALNQKERTRLVFLTEVQLGADAAKLPAGVAAQLVMPEEAE
jgi:HlyD family secretion protein